MSKEDDQEKFVEFWAAVRLWRDRLESNSQSPILHDNAKRGNIIDIRDPEPGNPSLNRLENAWAHCASQCDWPAFRDRENADKMAKAPLSALFGYVSVGLFPPPELLLALNDAYESYLGAGGEKTLEEAFFGPVKKRAGNYSRRAEKRRRDLDIAFHVASLNSDGLSDERAGENVANELKEKGISLEPETVIKIANRVMPRVKEK